MLFSSKEQSIQFESAAVRVRRGKISRTSDEVYEERNGDRTTVKKGEIEKKAEETRCECGVWITTGQEHHCRFHPEAPSPVPQQADGSQTNG